MFQIPLVALAARGIFHAGTYVFEDSIFETKRRTEYYRMYSSVPVDTLSAAFELLCYFFSAGAAVLSLFLAQR